MTLAERVGAIEAFGFTERQARFLVTVMLHAGVCLQRQYAAFAGLVAGQKTRDFFARLLAQRMATAYACAHNRGRIYHVHYKPLYRAIDEVNNRHRRPAFIGRAIERLMILDTVLANPQYAWLGAERDKMAHFTLHLRGQLEPEELPHLSFGTAPDAKRRYFPDKLPIGIDSDQREHVFVYLVTHPLPVDFRAFLQRHAELLRALSMWRIWLLLPRHLVRSRDRYIRALKDQLATPLTAVAVDELRRYFQRRHQAAAEAVVQSDSWYASAHRAFAAPRFRAMYRSWLLTGDSVLDAARSPVLAEALTRGTGRVETQVLSRRYDHLLPHVGTA